MGNRMKRRVTVIVATHKPYDIPDDGCYLPLLVGKACGNTFSCPDLYRGDDTGDNISDRNRRYCELTGLYWAWKNIPGRDIGLMHYRRYLAADRRLRKKRGGKAGILTEEELGILLDRYPVILPRKRWYLIETLYSHYAHTHQASHLTAVRKIISRQEPDYLASFDRVMKRRGGHMYNIFVMRRKALDAYCFWLFPILEELDREVDRAQYDDFQMRFVGRIGELLLDVWLDKNKLPCCEMPVWNREPIDWPGKIKAFLKAKYLGEKYRHSF